MITAWMRLCYEIIVARTHNEIRNGASSVTLSPAEWTVMWYFNHNTWLESRPGMGDGVMTTIPHNGFIGVCHNRQVYMDADYPNHLPHKPENDQIVSERAEGEALVISEGTREAMRPKDGRFDHNYEDLNLGQRSWKYNFHQRHQFRVTAA